MFLLPLLIRFLWTFAHPFSTLCCSTMENVRHKMVRLSEQLKFLWSQVTITVYLFFSRILQYPIRERIVIKQKKTAETQHCYKSDTILPRPPFLRGRCPTYTSQYELRTLQNSWCFRPNLADTVNAFMSFVLTHWYYRVLPRFRQNCLPEKPSFSNSSSMKLRILRRAHWIYLLCYLALRHFCSRLKSWDSVHPRNAMMIIRHSCLVDDTITWLSRLFLLDFIRHVVH